MIIIFLFFSLIGVGQEHHVSTEIKAENVFELAVIKTYPDSFPDVSVVFQAKNEFGKPLWQLDKADIEVRENNENCIVKRLINISSDKPVNIGLVLDHSGSMVDNPAQIPEGVESLQEQYFSGLKMPKDYTTALEFAKEGILSFLEESNELNDSIQFVGFSTVVDKIIPLTNEMERIKSFVRNVEPGGRTSFYDALFQSLNKLTHCEGKSVIVALTDGLDNESKHTYNEVIDLARLKNISIYTIGLGKANSNRLNLISKKTDGFHYYTNNPEKLKEIYLNIKEQIKSIYQLDYMSSNFNSKDENRTIKFSFVNDTLEFSNSTNYYSLPAETIYYLKKKEEERQREDRLNLIYGGLGILILGIGAFAISKRRKKQKLIIKKVFPNPFSSEVNFEFELAESESNIQLVIRNIQGITVFETSVTSKESLENVILEELSSGTYLANLVSSSTTSKPVKLIKK